MAPGELALDLFFVLFSAGLIVPAWRRYRSGDDTPAGWFVFTFSMVIALVAGGDILEYVGDDLPSWLPFAERTIMPIVPLIPYGLYRFADSFEGVPLRFRRVVDAVTVVLVGWGFAPGLPQPMEGSQISAAFTIAVVAYWLVVNGYAVARFWRAGRGQSRVVRLRVRLLSVANALILLIILISAASSGQGAGEAVTTLLPILFFALLYAGYVPPRWLRALMRSTSERQTSTVVARLMSTGTREEVGEVLLPAAAEILGSVGVSLFDRSGERVGAWGDAPAELIGGGSETAPTGTVADYEARVRVGLQPGVVRFEYPSLTLLLRSSPYTPLFGEDEIDIVDGICALADLAFARADLLHAEQERADRAAKLAQQEREAAERLRQTNELKNEFVALVAHDLRSPMSVIAGFAEALRDSWQVLDHTQRDHFLELIILNTQALSRLVEDVLQVARIEAGEFGYEWREFDLTDVITRTVEALDQHDAERVEVEAPEELSLSGDPDRLWQVVSNLIGNALKFSPADSTVRVSVSEGDDEAVVEIEDHGIGIQPEDMGRLFKKFSRLKQPPGSKVKGTGLGLYICKAIVEAHGGTISAASTPDDVTTFAFTLPRSAPQPSEEIPT